MAKRILILLALALFSFSCGNFNKLMKSSDIDKKYDAALNYYNEGDFYRAGLLFEDLMPSMTGTDRAEQLQFYYAYCHYEQKQYILASSYFRQFFDTYRRSPKAEEALYMSAYSLYKDAPDFNLDQSNTNDAIDEMQNFLNRFPRSEYATQANEVINELREKLELKAFDNAKLYSKIRKYKAATVAYDNFMKDYPDSDFKEEAMYRRIEAFYELAEISVYSKQQERYQSVIEVYKEFQKKYPESLLMKDADKLYNNADKKIKVIIDATEEVEEKKEA
ncbi:outer membrane protein assembly factor BamD [Sediminitomix flava]|uniref:Beta-barrel assembly machine subunit BamD n=1 Tax=Sediminitomix flava TaxID=379075 RepID=A0A315ZB51_SEDFL|nr:outer membrane protein assembly factor BamD [Sediminitomix flava]PWJ42816.1 Beta-barrel assembly machine subunit BamD [Sediminitomix flava]